MKWKRYRCCALKLSKAYKRETGDNLTFELKSDEHSNVCLLVCNEQERKVDKYDQVSNVFHN